ncbi:glycosyltransferase family 4 protein [Spirosoma koreense]
MNLLYLTFYFEPDIGPGAFRNTALVNELCRQLPEGSHIHVITTLPNRYRTYRPAAFEREERLNGQCRVTVERVALPDHASGQFDQIRAFTTYFKTAHRLIESQQYELIFASSSRLFTAFLGAKIARSRHIPLFLDIRDLFREAILDVHRSPFIRLVLSPLLRGVEAYTFQTARHINLVSEGFRPYFNPYPRAEYSYFTNGIDEAFLATEPAVDYTSESGSIRPAKEMKTILYAGNIGEGQGLHKIIPSAARQLGDRYRFVIIGDGGARRKLAEALQKEQVRNVELRSPVCRSALILEYQRADYLFLHLNDLAACRRVLPSKLFEYGATDKPILAGVAGFAASFIRQSVQNCILFEPGDVDSLVSQLRTKPYRTEVRTDFMTRFQRKNISQEMAWQVCNTLERG